MRGHGGSDDCLDPALMTWEAFAEDQHALLDHMHVARKVVVGGASMGAGSALWFATTQPQRVMGVIMVRVPTHSLRYRALPCVGVRRAVSSSGVQPVSRQLMYEHGVPLS
jgi:pimeloyl-ACP methyl ester carboxylesterase